jgi:hypothetical protein
MRVSLLWQAGRSAVGRSSNRENSSKKDFFAIPTRAHFRRRLSGMLYLPRLLSSQGRKGLQSETFKMMERRLMRAIINPAMTANSHAAGKGYGRRTG